MIGEQSIILQVDVNQNLVVTKLLMINATYFRNTIKIGLSLAELTNKETSNYINEIILSGKNNAKFDIKCSNDYFEGDIQIEAQKIHPQSYSITFFNKAFPKKEKKTLNKLENLLLDLSTDGIIVVDRFGYIQYSNYAFSEISKYTLENLKNKLFYPLFINFNEWTTDLSNNNVYFDNLLALDGSIIPVQIIKYDIRIYKKNTVYIIKNISQLKSFENELNIRENIIASIFFASQQFLFSTNWEDNIYKVLEHLGKSLHASRINLIKNELNKNNEICMKIEQSWTDKAFKHLTLSNQLYIPYFPHHEDLFFELTAGNIYYIDNDPKYKFYHHKFNIKSSILFPIFMKDKWWGILGVDECKQKRFYKNSEIQAIKQIANIIGASVYQQNIINELHILKDKSEESNRLKTVFLSNIGHELRTPLNAVLGFGELLKKPSLTPEKQNKFINQILDNSKKLLQSIDRLVNFSKLESETIQINPEPITIQNLLYELTIYANNEIRNQNKSIIISTQCDNSNTIITTDKKLFLQAFAQLISNAIKYTHAGRIELGCQYKNQQFLFFISDTGIGIEKDKITLIFTLFRMIENETTRIHSGMGIGLTIAQRIIKKLKGEIWIESEKGIGTTVFFTLPPILETSSKHIQHYEYKSGPKTIYMLEHNNEIYFKLYSILKLEYPNIIRIKKIEEIEPEKASMVILNSTFYTPDNINNLKKLTLQYPKIRIANHSFSKEKHNHLMEFILLPQKYEQILPTIKSILK